MKVQDKENKKTLNYFNSFLKTQVDLQEKILSNPDEDTEKMWNYVVRQVKEHTTPENGCVCDDGTLVLKYTKEYLDDYEIISKARKETHTENKGYEEYFKNISTPKEPTKEEIKPNLEVLEEEPKEIKAQEEKTPKKVIKSVKEDKEHKQLSIFDL